MGAAIGFLHHTIGIVPNRKGDVYLVQIYIKFPNYKPVEIKNKCHSPKFCVFYKKMSSPPQILVLYTCSFVTILYIWGLLFNLQKLGL